MTNLSIVFLNRSGRDMMAKAFASLPPRVEAEIIYVTSASVPDVILTPVGDQAWCLQYPLGLPAETDRVLGAQYSSGERLLFADTQSFLNPWEITNMAAMLTDTLCIVLRLHRPNAEEREIDNTSDLAAMALNQMLGQGPLAASSMLRFPHGLHRDAFQTVDIDNLRVPPKFMAQCILAGLNVGTFYRTEESGVDVGSEDMIIQTHLSAIHEILRQRGTRGGFTDFERRRNGSQNMLKAMKFL